MPSPAGRGPDLVPGARIADRVFLRDTVPDDLQAAPTKANNVAGVPTSLIKVGSKSARQ
jgi:hypothetical protein